MKRNKSGISLIVLVITIIVMIILAGAVVITLSNSGIIGKANEAVEGSDLAQVQHAATLIWADAYLEGITVDEEYIRKELKKSIDASKVDKYVIEVTKGGVKVSLTQTLGSLIKNPADDYGKTVNYEANGINNWKVFYEDEANGYVFLIAGQEVAVTDWPKVAVNTVDSQMYSIFKLGQTGYTLTDSYENSQMVAGLLTNYGAYASSEYGSYVVGAIGSPTLELFAAGYNAKYGINSLKAKVDYGYTNHQIYEEGTDSEWGMDLTNGSFGYFLTDNHDDFMRDLTVDNIYIYDSSYMLAAPSATDQGAYTGRKVYYTYFYYGKGYISYDETWTYGPTYPDTPPIRPVVCLKSNIPATATETGYSIEKVK